RQSIGQGDTDAPIFWLAVIYLNYAEAKAELGEFDGTVQSLTLDKLRARAGNIWGFTVVSDPRKNMNVSDLIYEIRRERRIELMYDINDRYYALQRWHCLYLLDTQKYPDQKKGAWIGTSADADKLFDVDAAIAAGASHPDIDAEGYIDCSSGNNRIYNNKYYLFPIPSDQQTLNPEIGQNYGW
ncbi:MAG: RagB/SusD family nutrient uptake outer membrane protein, partial [Paludibacteraceae bacterium]|nr:RagB/SusD family nutrient uptake outer membrane protein [Paludibacteraceae bacterium]